MVAMFVLVKGLISLSQQTFQIGCVLRVETRYAYTKGEVIAVIL
jgi:hypothetical protein